MMKLKLENSRSKKLIANYINCSSETVVVLAHGFTNDKSSEGRFDSLVEYLCEKNIDSLALDFAGSGESDDDALTARNQEDDLKVAIDFVRSKKYKNIHLFGNSFGTLACMRNYNDSVTSMILIGAVTDLVKYNWNDFFSEAELSKLENDGYFHLNNNRRHLITQQTLSDFEEINQVELMENIKCPVLLIHGDNVEDLEELELLENSKRAVSHLNKASKLKIIKGAKHGYHKEWNIIIELTWDWLSEFI